MRRGTMCHNIESPQCYHPPGSPELDRAPDPRRTSRSRVKSRHPDSQNLQESYIVSRIHYLLEHSTARQTPCLPSCKGTVSHVRYECTQFTSRHHLLYSNLTPQHPVPLASMSPNRSHQHPQHPRASPVAPFSPHLEDCPLYSWKLFCFSTFFCRSVTHKSPDLPEPTPLTVYRVVSQVL